MRFGVAGSVAVLAASLVVSASVSSAAVAKTSAGERALVASHTTAPDLYVNVKVTMTNEKFIVSRHSGPRGADARFELRNDSSKPHNFSLGNEKYGSGSQTGFSVTLKPGQHKILILFLDIRGTVYYHPGLAADKDKRGMRGSFHIGPCTAYEQNTGVGEC